MTKKTCQYFLSKKGCHYGDKCRNVHIPHDDFVKQEDNVQSENLPPSENLQLSENLTSVSESSAEIPADFICPISHDVMEYPYVTTQGNSYEYGEILRC